MTLAIVIKNDFFYFVKPLQVRAQETKSAIFDGCTKNPTLKVITMMYYECDDSFQEYCDSLKCILQDLLPDHLEYIEIFHVPTQTTHLVWQRK